MSASIWRDATGNRIIILHNLLLSYFLSTFDYAIAMDTVKLLTELAIDDIYERAHRDDNFARPRDVNTIP